MWRVEPSPLLLTSPRTPVWRRSRAGPVLPLEASTPRDAGISSSSARCSCRPSPRFATPPPEPTTPVRSTRGCVITKHSSPSRAAVATCCSPCSATGRSTALRRPNLASRPHRSTLHTQLVPRHDVRMGQLDGGLGLLDEVLDEVGVARQLWADLLDRQALFEA